MLPDHDKPELVQAAERQVRADEGSVGHVEVFRLGSVRTPILGRPRPSSRQRRAHPRLPLLLTQIRYEHPASIKDAEAQELATREAAELRRADSASAQLIRDGLDGLPADPTGLN
jgi:hypothetical protein